MADSLRLVTREGTIFKERDPVPVLAGSLPLVPVLRQGQETTAGAVLAAASVLSAIVGQDADWAIPASATHVVIPPLTASRTWSLPDVDGYPPGQDLVVVDEGGYLGGAYTVTLVPLAGSNDTIPAVTSNQIPLSDQYASSRTRGGALSNVWVIV